jgi:cobalt-zinc-cadmium efflux system protein
MKDSSNILLEGVPAGVDLGSVVADIKSIEGVEGVHSVHIWSICHNVYALSAHIDITPVHRRRMGEIFSVANERLAQTYHIFYTTLQAECLGCDQGGVLRQMSHKEHNRNHIHNH